MGCGRAAVTVNVLVVGLCSVPASSVVARCSAIVCGETNPGQRRRS